VRERRRLAEALDESLPAAATWVPTSEQIIAVRAHTVYHVTNELEQRFILEALLGDYGMGDE
jgi:hypothetical protein